MKDVMPLGIHASGKTHFVSLLGLHYQNLETQNIFLNINLKAKLFGISEAERFQLLENINDLRRGISLLKTYIAKPQAGAINIIYDVPFWKKKIHAIKCYDMSGELFEPIMQIVLNNEIKNVQESMNEYYKLDQKYMSLKLDPEDKDLQKSDVRNIYNSIFNSEIYFVILSLNQIWDIENGNFDETVCKSIREFNVKHSRLIENISNQSKIKKFAIIFTNFYSAKDKFFEEHGINSVEEFKSVLKGVYIEPIYTTIKDLFHEPEVFLTGTRLDGQPRFTLDKTLSSPFYTELEFDKIITWLESVL